MKYEITVIDDSPDSPLTHGSTSREPITIQRRTVVDFRVVKHSLTTSGEPSMTPIPPIPEDERELNLPAKEVTQIDLHKDCRERIAKLTAEVERLKADHAYHVSIQEPQHRQALEERDEARAENELLKDKCSRIKGSGASTPDES